MINDTIESKEIIEKEISKIAHDKEKEKRINMDDFLIPLDLTNEEDLIKAQNVFDEYFSKLDSTDLMIINESISECNRLSQYNIKITHEHLENLLIFAFKLGRDNEIYNKVLSFVSYILLTRPTLADEIIDSDILAQFMELLHEPMHDSEVSFMDNFFSCTYSVLKAANDKFQILSKIAEFLNDPSIQVEDFLHLLSIVNTIIDSYNKEQIGDIILYFFDEVVKKFIFSENLLVFTEICHLYMSMLEGCTKNELFQFMVKQPDFDDYLLQMIFNVDRQIYREYILGIFLNFSMESPEDYTKELFNNGILDKLMTLIPILTEENSLIMIMGIIQNFFFLGVDILIDIVTSEIIDVALNLLHEGSVTAKKAAIKFFCGICNFSEDPTIQSFLIEMKIPSLLLEFTEIPSTETWSIIMQAFYKNACTAYSSGIDEENLFEHPLFEDIDINNFYNFLSDIDHEYSHFEITKQFIYKGLQQNTLYFLELIQSINENI